MVTLSAVQVPPVVPQAPPDEVEPDAGLGAGAGAGELDTGAGGGWTGATAATCGVYVETGVVEGTGVLVGTTTGVLVGAGAWAWTCSFC